MVSTLDHDITTKVAIQVDIHPEANRISGMR